MIRTIYEVPFRLLEGDEIVYEKTAVLEANEGDVIASKMGHGKSITGRVLGLLIPRV